MIKKNFGQTAVNLKFITPEQLEQYSTASKNSGQSLRLYAKDNNLLTEDQFAQVYASMFSIEYLAAVTDRMANPDLLSKIPIKFLKENFIIPISYKDLITIVSSDPSDFQPIDELNLIFGPKIQIVVSTRKTILDAINRYYPLEGTKQMIEELEDESNQNINFTSIEEEDILNVANEAPIIKLVNHILYQAAKQDASDIHIEPFEKEIRVRYRVDGIMHPAFMPPKRAQDALISRIKIMANMDIAQKRIPQDNRIQINIAGKSIDIRVSSLPVTFGERIVMRLLDKTKSFSTLDKIGFSQRDYKLIEENIHQPNGIILITGPTGSGKTSTLYSILSELNSNQVNIVTVEDPVEYQMAGIGQVQVKDKAGLTFASALRSILRQDPDIVMIGETRDQETAQIAIQAALTGHLVLSTLHTNSAAAAITRLIDMGIEPFLISSSVICVVGQRLVRKLCSNCKKQYIPTSDILKKLNINNADKNTFYKPVGCHECLETGYKGRLAIFEVMIMSPTIAKLTMEKSDSKVIQNAATKEGMTLLIDDGIAKIKLGLTSIEEVLSVAAVQDGIEYEN